MSAFGGEGTGMQCAIDKSFVAGHSYQFSVMPVRGNRLMGVVTDMTALTSFDGRIKVTKAGAPATATEPSTEYVVHEDAIGNSASGPIRHTNGSCISTGTGAAGGALDLAKCADWVLAADGTIHTMTKCVDAENGYALLSACDGRKSQQWTLKNGVLRNVDVDRCGAETTTPGRGPRPTGSGADRARPTTTAKRPTRSPVRYLGWC